MLRVLDLFSGIGGFSLGLDRVGGFETGAFCEIAEYPRRVLARHWPKVPIYGDIRALNKDRLICDDIENIDIICGGFPCQDISTAGRGAGIDGDRSGLWAEYARLIGELRPKYAIIENVSALLRRGIECVLADLAKIGYDAEWHCIPASYVGASHRRDRLWIVAYPASQRQSGSRESFVGRYIAAQREGQTNQLVCVSQPFQWCLEPDVGRVAPRIPKRMERLTALGNAVVPQIPQLIGGAILKREIGDY